MIICFSGTGNSAAVADRIASLLSDNILKIDMELLRLIAEGKSFEVGEPDRVIWVFPVYAWGLPKVVSRVMQTIDLLPAGRTTSHWMVATKGDDIGLTADQWRREMRLRNFNAVAAFSVAMPNTYVFLPGFSLDSPPLAAQKREGMIPRVARIAKLISAHTPADPATAPPDDVVRGSAPWIKSKILRPLFDRFLTSPDGFYADTERCTRCGRCSRTCPLDNITIDPAKGPQWGKRCTFCTACYHACPERAIGWRALHAVKR